MQWYVVHTLTGHEHKVKKILLKMIKEKSMEESFGNIVIPVENQVRIRKGKKVDACRPGFTDSFQNLLRVTRKIAYGSVDLSHANPQPAHANTLLHMVTSIVLASSKLG